MSIVSNISLFPYNTFGINVSARYFFGFSSRKELGEVFQDNIFKNEKKLVLGGGSNLLLTQHYEGLVLKNEIKGIKVLKEDDEHIYVEVGAGETWHTFVLFCIANNYAGVENLSLIPGSVGAAPMQNIGAYGVELKQVFHQLQAFHIETGEYRTFSNEDCNFGYRESVFKNVYRNQYIITSVTFKLDKVPQFNISYGAIEQELELMGVTGLSIKAISDAVTRIRQSKLPDPAKIGNAGSFFKNPVISNEQFSALKKNFPQVVGYPGDMETKVAAGWLIEQAGWKGKTFGNYGVHKNQALVLVNYGGATGQEIYNLSQDIIDSVGDKFEIELQREVNII